MAREDWSTGGRSRLTRKNTAKETTSRTKTAGNGKSSAGSGRAKAAVKKSTKEKGIAYLTFLLIILLVGAVYIGFKMTDRLLAFDNSSLLEDDPNPAEQVVEPERKKRDVFSVLLIGLDQRGNEPARGDSNILAMFDKKTKEMHLISLPRDTRVQIQGRNNEKLGHAYAFGGGSLTKKTAEEILGISIDGYIATNFNGFANIVDIIGGIELNVESRMYYPEEDIDLYPGLQTLKGEDALAYVRYRSDGRGDIGRMERQQKFLKVLAKELMSVSNVLQIPNLVRELNSNVKTDLGVLDMVNVANLLKGVDLNNLNAQTLPGEATWIGQVNYWQLDQKQVDELLDEIYFLPEEE